MSAITFIGMTVYLMALGRAVSKTWLLALPIGALINTLGIFVLTVIGIPLEGITNMTANLVVTVLLMISLQPLCKPNNIISPENTNFRIPHRKILLPVCIAILVSVGVYAISHALLPTFHYDSVTNWNMRSKISFLEQAITFDGHDGAILKPHYPFAYHALQITAQQWQVVWSDTYANLSHLILSISSVTAIFILLKKLKGFDIALVCTALVLGIPLMTLHAGQSYADITLVLFALLSLVTFVSRYFILSALFVSACVWTKSEGLFFCLLPWLVVIGKTSWDHPELRRYLTKIAGVGMLLSIPWILFVLLSGMSLTPHGGSDIQLAVNIDAVRAMARALFVQGSFGILWYSLLGTLVMIIVFIQRNSDIVDRRYVVSLLWGLLAFVGYIFVYLFTSNTEYLLLGQSFDRQMLLPASLLIVSAVLCLSLPKSF